MISTMEKLQTWIKQTSDFCFHRTVCFVLWPSSVFSFWFMINILLLSSISNKGSSIQDTNIQFFGMIKVISDEHEWESGLAFVAVNILLGFRVLFFSLSLCILMRAYACACECDRPEVHLSGFFVCVSSSKELFPEVLTDLVQFYPTAASSRPFFASKATCVQFMYTSNNVEIVSFYYLNISVGRSFCIWCPNTSMYSNRMRWNQPILSRQ